MASAATPSKLDTFVEEKYLPLKRDKKIIIAVLVFLLPLLLFYFLVYRPGNTKLTRLERDKKTLLAELDQAKGAAQRENAVKAEMEETRQRFEKAEVLLPKKKEIPALLRSISDLGKSAGLEFLSFKPVGETTKDFYAEIPVDISIRGPYHNMGYFLDKVSKLDRIVTVNNIKMGSPKQEDGEMLLNSTCRLVTYRFLSEEEIQEIEKQKKAGKKKKK